MTPPWMIAFAVLTLFVVVQGVAIVGILRRVSVVLGQAEEVLRSSADGPGGLEAGADLPALEGLLVDGSTVTEDLFKDRASVILFMSRNCPACRALENDLVGRDVSLLRECVVAVVGDIDYATSLAEATGFTAVVQRDRSVAGAFESTATPQAFAITSDGLIAGNGTPNTFDSLRDLVLLAQGGDPAETEGILVGVER